MCGIVGIIDFEGRINESVLKEMINTLSHRGPDNQNAKIYVNSRFWVGLAHARLSIIDLTELANQPMEYKDYCIVFNGEIYNYEELKQNLIKTGHHFISNSDTEVILHAFEEWGVYCLHKFIGMFAFALFDKRHEKMFLFRDRAGVKPLYYYWSNNLLLFASELKAFHRSPAFKKGINIDTLALYFQYGYIPAPYTIFNNAFKINPGCYVEIDMSTKHIEEKKYWDIVAVYNRPKLKISVEEALSETESLLSSAVQYRMVADVPVGVFLSGGYDSAAVTALLQKNSSHKIKTFTIGFDYDGYNEAPFARGVADYLRTDHTEYYCTQKEAMEIIPDLPFYYDEPFGDSSAIPTILVSRLAKKKVKVALSADGGDEIFGGYSKYESTLKNIKKLSYIPARIRYLVGLLMANTDPSLIPFINRRYRYKTIYEGAYTILMNKKISAPMVLKYSSQCLLKGGLSQLFNVGVEQVNTGFEEEDKLNDFNDAINKMLAIDYSTYMPGDILTKVDRATMSVSIEGREPLLDHRIIEFVASLPSCYKINYRGKKYLLKQIVHKYIPSTLMERPKTGFGIPIKHWFRGDLKFLIMEYLNKDKLNAHGLFDVAFVQSKIEQYFNGKDDDFELIWYLLQFQMWFFKWY